jgi:Integrase core domain
VSPALSESFQDMGGPNLRTVVRRLGGAASVQRHGIFSVLARRKGRRPRPGEPVHQDLVRRQFGAAAPNELWFTDLTEHRTDEGKLCVCAVKDAFSGRIVGYSMDRRMKAHLSVAALPNAIGLRSPVANLVGDLGEAGAKSEGLSRVAEADDAVVGHVMFTRSLLDAAKRLVPVQVLSPVGVSPAWQTCLNRRKHPRDRTADGNGFTGPGGGAVASSEIL